MRILFYNHTSTISGAERVLLLIATRLSNLTPVIMCPRGELADITVEQGIDQVEIPELSARFTWRLDRFISYLISLLRAVSAMRGKLAEVSPDLIHANSTRAGIIVTLASLRTGIPVVWHIHDILPSHPITTAVRLLIRFSGRARLFAVSEATAQALRGRLLRSIPIKVILNCADQDRFKPDPTAREQGRAGLGLDTSEVAIGIVGQITQRKGQLGLIEAFKKVVPELPGARLFVIGKPLFTAGDQEYFDQLRKDAAPLETSGKVAFLGSRPDVAVLMQALDLLVVNSLAEPCGLVVLEGMASSLPVIATKVGGNPEMIIDRQSGWLVPEDDPQSLAAAIVQLAINAPLRRGIGIQARARVVQRFTIPLYLSAVTEFYLSCLALPISSGDQANPQIGPTFSKTLAAKHTNAADN